MPNFNNRPHGGYTGNRAEQLNQEVSQVLETARFNSLWITDSADSALVDFAEQMGKYMAINKLTNSKIRSIYGEIKRIQMGIFEKEKSSFFLLRPKVAYALGREPENKGLIMFKLVFDMGSKYVTDQKTYLNFCNLIESILAYHKAYGGKD